MHGRGKSSSSSRKPKLKLRPFGALGSATYSRFGFGFGFLSPRSELTGFGSLLVWVSFFSGSKSKSIRFVPGEPLARRDRPSLSAMLAPYRTLKFLSRMGQHRWGPTKLKLHLERHKGVTH